MMITWDTDNPTFSRPIPGVIPRRDSLVYGSSEAERVGLTPLDELPDKLVTLDELPDVIAHCHDQNIYPMYWEKASWRTPGRRYNQNGLGYCVYWSGVGAYMNLRYKLDYDHIDLAPVSMGWIVNWRNEGTYLEKFLTGMQTRGVAPASMCGGLNSHQNDPRAFEPGWEEAALNYRLGKVFDTENRADAQTRLLYLATVLRMGLGGFGAWNHLGHAMQVVGLLWTPGTFLNCTLIVSNSHNEDDFIKMTGSLMVPNECYGLSTVQIAA